MNTPTGTDGRGKAKSPAVRAYRALLRVLPRAVRAADGDEMERTFAAMWAQRGVRGRVVLGAASLIGLMMVAVAEWIEALGAAGRMLRRRGNRSTPSSRRERASERKNGSRQRGSRAGIHAVRSRSFAVRGSWLDFKVGLRMLAKYPGVSLIGGLAMAFAICVGASAFELVTQLFHPRLPVPDGDRIVAIRLVDAQSSDVEQQATYDFVRWRDQLTTVDELGAFDESSQNLAIEGSGVEPIDVVEISASAFRLMGDPPALGRTLLASDEAPGAPAVVVIGHDVWQRRFGGDPAVVGRSVRLGSTQATVVGVMPAGFAFPIAHSLWVPLRLSAHEGPREGPAIRVFGRLADGASLVDAQTELDAAGARLAAAEPDTHAHLRPRVLPYARSVYDFSAWRSAGTLSSNVVLVLLLVLICSNVGLLMFARAASRESEIVVRSALGASRTRIVLQLFAEALVLGGVAAVVGLAATGTTLRWAIGILEFGLPTVEALPFWIRDTLSPATIVYAAMLTVLGAAIAGVVPGLKVTRGLQARLRASSAGAGGPRMGGVWTAVIVAQIAVTVALPIPAFSIRGDAEALRRIDPGLDPASYLVARLEMDYARADSSVAAFHARAGRTYAELERRLGAEPAVGGVTFGDRLPRMSYAQRPIEVDSGGAEPRDPGWTWPGYRVARSSVGVGFFDAFAAPVLSGRGFHMADTAPGQRVVIVNQSFVERVLGARNPIGRRLRYLNDGSGTGPAPWHEIVGVVPDLGTARGPSPIAPAVYHPVTPNAIYPLQVAVRVHGDVRAFMPRLREIGTAVDPALRLYARPMETVRDEGVRAIGFAVRLILVACAVALLLSLAGIYATMSFALARRTREIGIRVALGASARGIVISVFRRPLTQLGLGIAAGAVLVLWLMGGTQRLLPIEELAVLGVYVVFMAGVCVLACIVPTRRALRVEPTEALRSDA
jgi:putative ABC transport system permease protein